MNKLVAHLLIVHLCFLLVGCKNVLDIDMIYVPGGSFLMGSNEAEADSDESPIHIVHVKDFYIGKYEVSQELWKAVMMRDPSRNRGLDFPVENVSWDDCQKFIEKLNRITGKKYRLPTEEEWEYVASKSYKKIKDEDITSYAWCRKSFGKATRDNITSQKIGSLKADSLGIYDLIGNVNEWCSNSYDSLSYLNGFSQENDEKVFRGGCFANEAKHLRPTNRNHINRYTRHYTLGFRLAMDACAKREK
jgi:formylglycine-generating enzyme required for sulfatase activity